MAREIKIAILGDASGFSRAVASVDADASKLSRSAGRLGTAAKAAMAGAGIAAVGFAKSSVSAFVESEEAQKRLSDAFERFPNLAGTNQAALQKLNSEIQKKTKFDDDALASGQAVVAQFGVTGKQLESITPLIADYASRTGKDIPSAAQDVGKAMLGNAKALKNIGIKYTATGDTAKDFANIQELLRKQVGGFAEKEGQTAAGQAAILKNQFGELQEKVGSKLVPVLQTLATKLLDFGKWLGDHKPVLIAVATVIGVGLVTAFIAWAAAAASAAVATIAATWPIIAIAAAIAALVAGVIWAYKNWGFFREAVDKVASFVTGILWPALQTIVAFIRDKVIPVVVDVISAFVNFATKVGEVAGTVIGKVIDIATGIADFVSDAKGKFDDIVSFVAGLPDRIASAASGMWDGIKNTFRSAINWIIRGWNRLEFKIPGFDPPGPGPKFGGFTLGLPDIPQLALGGIVTRPTLAMIGEAGPEAVVPLDRRGSSSNITINITTAADPQAVVEAVSRYVRTNGQPAWNRAS